MGDDCAIGLNRPGVSGVVGGELCMSRYLQYGASFCISSSLGMSSALLLLHRLGDRSPWFSTNLALPLFEEISETMEVSSGRPYGIIDINLYYVF